MDKEQHSYSSLKLGKIEIAPEVIQIISGLSASQVEGVLSLSGGVVGNFNELLGRKNLRKGISVEVGDHMVIELAIVVKYGFHLPDVGRAVQENVKLAVETMTGLNVAEVIVRIEEIRIPQGEKVMESSVTPRLK